MSLLVVLYPIFGAGLTLVLCHRAKTPWIATNYATLAMLLEGYLSMGETPADAPAVGALLFPYLRPGAIPTEAPRPGFLGLAAYALALVALVGQPFRRTKLPALLAAIGAGIACVQRPITGLPLFAAGTATLAALGVALLTDGLEHRATRRQREVLAVLTALLGGLCFHLISLYLRGGNRPGEAPTLAMGLAFSLSSFAAAFTPMVAMLVGAWSDRRRHFAALVAAASIVELAALCLGKMQGAG